MPDFSDNALFLGDNLGVLDNWLASNPDTAFDLIYFDPPFQTGDHFGLADAQGIQSVYKDRFESQEAYVEFLSARIQRLHQLLKPHGALFLHCDWRANSAVRLLLDRHFGAANYRNEIIWRRGDNRGRKAQARQLGRTCDSIFYYVRDASHPDIRFQVPVRTRRHPFRANGKPPAGFYVDEEGRTYKTAPRGDYTDASIERLEAQGRIHHTRNGKIRIKYFLEREGECVLEPVPVDTLWTDIPDAMHLPAQERFGFPTQKPLALMRRIVAMASNPGDRVLDPFCGSGTTLVAAAEAGRRFSGIDVQETALNLAVVRLSLAGCSSVRVQGDRSRPLELSLQHAAFQLQQNGADQVALTCTRAPEGNGSEGARGVRLSRKQVAEGKLDSPTQPSLPILLEGGPISGQHPWIRLPLTGAMWKTGETREFRLPGTAPANELTEWILTDRLGRRFRLKRSST